MKSVEELATEVIRQVRVIDKNLPITDCDIACIAGISMHVLTEETIANNRAASEAPQTSLNSTKAEIG